MRKLRFVMPPSRATGSPSARPRSASARATTWSRSSIARHLRGDLDDEAGAVAAMAVARVLDGRAVRGVGRALDEHQGRAARDSERPRLGGAGGDRLQALHRADPRAPEAVAPERVEG